MNRPFRSSLARTLTAASCLILLAGAGALAQQPADDHPLSGPKVEDRQAPGVNPTLDGQMRDRRQRAPQNPAMLHWRALMSLDNADLPEDTRLTPDQRAAIEKERNDYMQALRAFRQEHREEIESLRGPGDGPRQRGQQRQGRTPGERPELTPEQQEKAAQLRALMEKAPKPDDYLTRAWATLNDNQRTIAEERLQQQRERTGEQGERTRQRRGAEGDQPQRRRDGAQPDQQRRRDAEGRPGRRAPQGAPPPPPARQREAAPPQRGPRAQGDFPPPTPRAFAGRPGQRPAPDAAPEARRPVTMEDLRARIDALPPEQRQRVLQRLMQALDRAEARAPHQLPPPAMDDLDLPAD